MDSNTEEPERKSFSIYVMESDQSWYIGSAWNKPPEERYRAHYGGYGGARKLWDAIQSGVAFTQRILDSGTETLWVTRCLEESWIANFLVTDSMGCLNIDLFPSTSGGRVGIIRDPEQLAARNARISEVKSGKPNPAAAAMWADPDKRNALRVSIAQGMANMSDEAAARMRASISEARWADYEQDTHCRYGHEYTEDNTYWSPAGDRQCRECRRRADRDRRERENGGPIVIPWTATHCRHGHEYTEENTYVHPKTGIRQCRACREINGLAWRVAQKDAKSMKAEV